MCQRPNSPDPLTDDWKVMDDSSVNFHDEFFFIFCTSWKFMDESSVSGPGEFGLTMAKK